ncbi:hypothetical protein [Bacteroides sp.]|uniref:hypothetical protein n=1 Tax=Bacteroides sp. TaxID=29523 RepID=UPI00261756C7|nr:hypothetical protein [Bacteroides sp.]MDD3037894.1 hypothetical protein [Bacteroides sp.]
MSQNKPKPDNSSSPIGGSINTVALRDEVQKAQSDGYVALPMSQLFGDRAVPKEPQWSDVLNTMFSSSSKGESGGNLYASVGKEYLISSCGTKGKGYMEWGSGNRLPNAIALLTSLLPYTAAGVKFNTDTAAGLGPKPKYRYSYYTNGALVTKEIDYSDAGLYLEGQLIGAHGALGDFYKRCRENDVDISKRLRDTDKSKETAGQTLQPASATNNTASAFGSQPEGARDADGKLLATDAEIRINQQMEQRMLKQVADAELAYHIWEKTNKEVKIFLENNNLDLIFLELFNDMCHMGICFPEIGLEQQALQENTVLWNPKVSSISHRSTLTCRLERMDEENHINYVYVSNRWLDQSAVATVTQTQDIAAFHALDPQRPLASLRAKVRDTRLKAYNGKKDGRGTPIGERPTRFILPEFYPTMGRPYYPQPSWWTVFGGEIYKYASTLIENRVTARENSNMWGKIIYVHTEYLNKLFLQEQAATKDERDKIRDKLWKEINTFLKDRSKNGSTLLSFTFTGNDGKEHEAFRIVDVPQGDKDTASVNKTELAEAASIIFFALEIHPDLIGAVPGRSGSSGGTYQREMYEMKKLMMAPTQNLVLKVLEMTRDFNEWDSHLVWPIKQMSLTTLDRNATGVEETKV